MTDRQEQRRKFIEETNALGNKPRFALFSQPVSTAIGDDGPYKPKLHPREGESGKPITQPKNFSSGPCRSGQLQKSFFGNLNSLVGSDAKHRDEYIEEPKRLLIEQNKTSASGPKMDAIFKHPSSTGMNILWTGSYKQDPKLIKQKQELDPRRFREQSGRVKSKPKNFETNPQSTVVSHYFKDSYHHFCKQCPNDPYNRAHELEVEKNKQDKMLEGETKFKPNSFHNKTFSSNLKTYGLDVEIKPKQQKQTQFNIYKHDNTWKTSSPNKSGHYGLLSPFPQYIENPPRAVVRKSVAEKKDTFKPMNSNLTRPTPSITAVSMNLRCKQKSSLSLHK